MNIDEYVAGVERGLRQNARSVRIEEPITCLASDDHNGVLRCRASFWDNSFLDIYEAVSTELGHPIRIHYSYTYVRGSHVVFRYDNAPHHPEVVTHPHHKHIGKQQSVSAADQPSLSQVLAEAATWVEE